MNHMLEVSCGVFLGYRILPFGWVCVYLGSVKGITDKDLDAIVDFSERMNPDLEAVFVYESDDDEASLIYDWKLRNWRQDI